VSCFPFLFVNTIKTEREIMGSKVTLFKDIKTPETLEEFHENLRKFYVCPRDFIYVMNHLDEIKVESLNSLSDLYERCPEQTPMVTPKVVWEWKDVKKHMKETGQDFSSDGFFDNEDNFKIYEDQEEFFRQCDTPKFYNIDNQILREFYIKTLGEFSGY